MSIYESGKPVKSLLAEYVDGGPGCVRDDCMITENGPSIITSAYYPPVYDKQGNNTNPDMNITTQQRRCLSCGKTWTEKYQNGARVS